MGARLRRTQSAAQARAAPVPAREPARGNRRKEGSASRSPRATGVQKRNATDARTHSVRALNQRFGRARTARTAPSQERLKDARRGEGECTCRHWERRLPSRAGALKRGSARARAKRGSASQDGLREVARGKSACTRRRAESRARRRAEPPGARAGRDGQGGG